VVERKGPLHGFGPDPDHELTAHDAGEHVPFQQERKAAEHFALGHFRIRRHNLTDPVGEVLVVGHRASHRPG